MGFVAMGIAVFAVVYGNLHAQGITPEMQQSGILAANGAVLQMFNHGLTAAIFPFQRIIGLTIRFREKDFSTAVIDPESRRQN
jgi:NADH:ubiquinone oxidoreductase subunit 4 (subunit M)